MKRSLEDTKKNGMSSGNNSQKCPLRLSIVQEKGAIFSKGCFSKSESSSLLMRPGVTYKLGRAAESWYQTSDRRISRCHAEVTCIEHVEGARERASVLLTARGLNTILAVVEGTDLEVRTNQTVKLGIGDGFRLAATIHPLIRVLSSCKASAGEEVINTNGNGSNSGTNSNGGSCAASPKRARLPSYRDIIANRLSAIGSSSCPDENRLPPPKVLYLNRENLEVLDGKPAADPNLLRLREARRDASEELSQSCLSGLDEDSILDDWPACSRSHEDGRPCSECQNGIKNNHNRHTIESPQSGLFVEKEK